MGDLVGLLDIAKSIQGAESGHSDTDILCELQKRFCIPQIDLTKVDVKDESFLKCVTIIEDTGSAVDIFDIVELPKGLYRNESLGVFIGYCIINTWQGLVCRRVYLPFAGALFVSEGLDTLRRRIDDCSEYIWEAYSKLGFEKLSVREVPKSQAIRELQNSAADILWNVEKFNFANLWETMPAAINYRTCSVDTYNIVKAIESVHSQNLIPVEYRKINLFDLLQTMRDGGNIELPIAKGYRPFRFGQLVYSQIPGFSTRFPSISLGPCVMLIDNKIVISSHVELLVKSEIAKLNILSKKGWPGDDVREWSENQYEYLRNRLQEVNYAFIENVRSYNTRIMTGLKVDCIFNEEFKTFVTEQSSPIILLGKLAEEFIELATT